MKHDRLFVFTILLALLAGCAGSGSNNPGSQRAEKPIEQQTAQAPIVADERQRAKVHTDLGIAYLRDGKYEVALSEAQIAIDSLDSYAPAYNLLGLIYMALRQSEQAEANFRRAVGLAPNNPEINNNFGWFLCQNGKIKESFAYFNQVLRNPLYQTPAKALHNLGVCAIMDKDDASGEAYLFRALKLDSNNLRAYYLLADLGYRNKRYDDARDWLKQLHAKMDPTAETAWLALRIDRKLGNREGEARNAGILRRNYRDSPEFLQMSRGEFD
ncbi:MAG: type IV pilus biogenesis/stability protein PilW [Rhodocyclaceae bacterium]|nr:type IV pilus biogenesis/stability protein PilW [Rhodocyclaceae bacterium]